MTYIDIEGIVEEKSVTKKAKVADTITVKKSKDIKKSSPSSFIKLCSVFCFLGVFTFIVVQFLNEVPEFEKIVTEASADVTDIKISNKVSFRSLADIEPAAGDALDDLLEWDGGQSQSKKVSPKREQPSRAIKREVKTIGLMDQMQNAVRASAKAHPEYFKMQQSIDTLTKQVEANKFARDNTQVSKSKFDSLNNSVKTLAERIIEMQSQIKILNNKVVALEGALVEAEKKSAKALEIEKVKKVKKPTINNPWILRSARKGTAWVSHKGKDNLTSISVGDELDIIGKVIKIGRNSKGKWYVECEKGEINQ